MRPNAFIGLHRATENAGYPALLIAAMVCLGLVVAPIALLALTQAGWALALALLSIGLALAVLAGVIGAALAADDSPPTGPGDENPRVHGRRDLVARGMNPREERGAP